MATAVLPIVGSWWGHGGNGLWNEANYIWCGKDSGANYRSKVAVSTAGLTVVKSTALVLGVRVSGLSSPFGLECILTQDNSILANDCQNSLVGAASESLNQAAIARSFAYADKACSTLLTAEDGVNMAAGGQFWLRFDTAQLKQDQAYYLYFIRNLRDGYTGSAWVQAYTADMEAVLEYINYTAITAPASFKALPEVFEGAVNLSWEPAVDGQSNPVALYQIHFQDSDDGQAWSDWCHLADCGVAERSYVDYPGIQRGSYRRYHLRAIGSTGIEEYHSLYVSTDARKNRAPAAPGDLRGNALIVSGGEVQLSWTAAEDPDGQPVRYIVGRMLEGQWVETDNGESLSFSEVRTDAPGEKIQYAVRSADSLGMASDWVLAPEITVNSSPSAPTQVILDKTEYSPGDSVTVSWNGADDEDGNLSEYKIYAFAEGAEGIPLGICVEDAVNGESGGGSYTFQPNQLDYQQTMRLAVCAIDTLGAVSDFAYSEVLRRNDRPHVHVFQNSNPGNYVPVAAGERYMPYIRVNGQWLRHPGQR